MTDDIATRLRELLDGPVPMSVERQDVREAADEIEGLRAENRRLHLSLMVAYSEAAGMYDDRNEANHD